FKKQLKKMPNGRRKSVINRLQQCFDDIEVPKGLMLSWEDIIQIKNAGIEIGSHTVGHPPLAAIEDDKEVEFELLHSANLIKDKTGEFPKAISYPVSSYDERVKNISRQAGYKIGFAVDQDIYDSTRYDNFQIPRIDLYNENFFKAKLRISGILGRLKKLLRKF
ncbi:MAG: polysaccharide deacetylase family protein, partial [Candidatus Omnitrophica bacterium]|nr:polysaccharide deacetylase family protein [Candidatus Omnitrophota bacterium]